MTGAATDPESRSVAESVYETMEVAITEEPHNPVNAMLNYACAVLIAQTQIRLILEGYDPTNGIMQKRALRGINPGFALDHMEPMRPVVDRAVVHLIDAVTFTGADFSIQHDGVCRMNPELARRVAQLALKRCELSRR